VFAVAAAAGLALPVLSVAADLHVDAVDGNDGNDGLSWVTAKATLGAALSATATPALPGPDTVHVAEGVYAELIVMPPDVTMLGGYPVGGGVRDPAAHRTVIDARGRGTVVRFGAGTDACVLDGFVVTGGRGLPPAGWSGGIVVSDSTPLIRRCVIERNERGFAGGVYLALPRDPGRPVLEDCIIRSNRIEYGGPRAYGAGGVWGGVPGTLPTVLMRSCVVEGNVHTVRPTEGEPRPWDPVVGGIWVNGNVEGCIVRGNSEHGMRLTSGHQAVNCEISGNNGYGIMSPCDAVPDVLTLTSCTLSRNRLGAVGGWPDGEESEPSVITLRDSIVWDEGPYPSGGPPGCGTTPVLDHVIWEGGWPDGTAVMDADPLFVAGPAGAFYLGQSPAGQPLTSPGVDAGSTMASGVGLDGMTTRTDLVGDAGVVDLGVHYPVAEVVSGRPFAVVDVLRGAQPTALAVIASVGSLPSSDAPGVLSDPTLPLLFYRVEPAYNDVRLAKDVAASTVRLSY
jgi:hypothetical protein